MKMPFPSVPRPRKLNQRGFDHVLVAILCVVAVGVVGAAMAVASHAATSVQWKGVLEAFNSGSNYCLTSNGSATSSKVVLDPCKTSDNNQVWSLTDIKTATVLGATNVQEFYLQNGAGTNECLNNPYGSKTNGAAMQLYTCKSTDAASVWVWGAKLTTKGYSSHQLINLASISGSKALCLDDAYGATTAGTKVQGYGCKTTTGQSNQSWLEDSAPSSSGGSSSSSGSSSGGCSYSGTVAPCIGGATTGASGWGSPAFDDEFNGTSLNTTNWNSSWFNGGTMNNVNTSASNVSESGGNLILTLSSSSTGALVSTNPSGGGAKGFTFGTGYFAEARVYFPGSGSDIYNWPAFWVDGQSWPTDGEIDVAEGLGQLTSNYHSPQGANNGPQEGSGWASSWHTYAVDRANGTNTIYWDGKVVRSYSTDDGGAPEYLIFNVGCSGGCTTGSASQVKVDYVRVWKKQ